MLKRVFIYMCIIATFVACSKDDSEGLDQDSGQTTLMYFMGTDLKSYYNANIKDVKSAVALDALGRYGSLYYLYPDSSTSATLYELTCEGGVCVETEVCKYENFTTTDAGSLSMVLADVKVASEYTSDRTMNLIIGSHGFGWRLSSSATKAATLSEDGDYKNIWTRYLGVSTDGFLDIEDLCNDLDGTHFGYVLFDACLMSSVEVLYRMRSHCDYVVASPCEVLTPGFPYDTVLPELFESDGRESDLLGACQAFYDFYSTYSYPYGAVAMCVMSELEALAESVKALELADLTATQRKSVQAYDNQSSGMFYDLGDLIDTAYVSGDYEAFTTQMERTFPSEYLLHTAKYLTALTSVSYVTINSYSGVSTSHMSTNSWAAGWSNEPWAVAIGANN